MAASAQVVLFNFYSANKQKNGQTEKPFKPEGELTRI